MVNGEGFTVNGLSQAALGRALNLSGAAITKLKKQGMPVASVEAAQRWRQNRQNVAQRKPAPVLPSPVPNRQAREAQPEASPEFLGGESHDAARTRREIAEANLAELKLRELRGELIRREVMERIVGERAAALREAVLQVKSRLTPLLAAEADAAKVSAMLDTELRTALKHGAVG